MKTGGPAFPRGAKSRHSLTPADGSANVELAMRRYLAGDVSALREYLESIGRAELPVPCL